MTLFLASAASKTLDLLLPHLPKSPQMLKVAFILTASDPYDDKSWMEGDRKKLVEIGFTVFDIDLKNKTETEIRTLLTGVDIIFVSGGNTFYLLEKVKISGFDNVVKELVNKGVIYIGSSAGSLLLAPNIESIKVFDDPKEATLESYEAVNLVNFVVLPHYKKGEYNKNHELVMNEFKDKYKFIVLTDQQAVLVTDGNYKIVEAK